MLLFTDREVSRLGDAAIEKIVCHLRFPRGGSTHTTQGHVGKRQVGWEWGAGEGDFIGVLRRKARRASRVDTDEFEHLWQALGYGLSLLVWPLALARGIRLLDCKRWRSDVECGLWARYLACERHICCL